MNRNTALILSLGMIIASLIIGTFIYLSESYDIPINEDLKLESPVLTLNQASEYLKISEQDLKIIIAIEEQTLKQRHSFSGAMLSYYKVDDKMFFYKERLDIWIEDVSIDKRKYDFDKRILYR